MRQYDQNRQTTLAGQRQDTQRRNIAIAGISGALLLSGLLLYEDVIVPDAAVWLGWGAAIGLASFLLVGSVIGLHLQIRSSYGRLGRIGMALLAITFASFGLMGVMVTGLSAIGMNPETYRLGGVITARVFGSIGMLGMPIGALVLGTALWRHDLASKAVAALLVLAFPGQFVHIATVDVFMQLTGRGWGILLFVIPLGLGWIGLCYYVWHRPPESR